MEQYNTGETIFPGKLALWIIWSAGLVCIMVIWLFISWPDFAADSAGAWMSIKNNRKEAGLIDELLVSSEELKDTGQKSLVNVTLRPEWNHSAPAMNEDNNRKQFYNDILKKKLQHLGKTAASDFSIRPVPK